MTVKGMKGGALEFLTNPFDDEVLLNAIRHAIKRSEAALGREIELQTLRAVLWIAYSPRTGSDDIGGIRTAAQACG